MAHSFAPPNPSKLCLSSALFIFPPRLANKLMIPYHLTNMISPRINMNRRVRLVQAMQSPGSNNAEPTQNNPKVQWILGTIIFVALPSYKRFSAIEDQLDKTAEAVVEIVEKVAETTEKISLEVAEALPEDSELKKIALKVEHVAEEVVKDAELVDSVIDKVDDFVDEVDAMVEPIIEGKLGGDLKT